MSEYLFVFIISLVAVLAAILFGYAGAMFMESVWRAWQRRKIRKAYGRYGAMTVDLYEFYAKKNVNKYRIGG